MAANALSKAHIFIYRTIPLRSKTQIRLIFLFISMNTLHCSKRALSWAGVSVFCRRRDSRSVVTQKLMVSLAPAAACSAAALVEDSSLMVTLVLAAACSAATLCSIA